MKLDRLRRKYGRINDERSEFIFCIRNMVQALLEEHIDTCLWIYDALCDLMNSDKVKENSSLYSIFNQKIYAFINYEFNRKFQRTPVLFTDGMIPAEIINPLKNEIETLRKRILTFREEENVAKSDNIILKNDLTSDIEQIFINSNLEDELEFCEDKLSNIKAPYGFSGYFGDDRINRPRLDFIGIMKEIKINSSFRNYLGCTLASPVFVTWVEDAIDEDTGELVSIVRNQVMFESGATLDEETIDEILKIKVMSVFLVDGKFKIDFESMLNDYNQSDSLTDFFDNWFLGAHVIDEERLNNILHNFVIYLIKEDESDDLEEVFLKMEDVLNSKGSSEENKNRMIRLIGQLLKQRSFSYYMTECFLASGKFESLLCVLGFLEKLEFEEEHFTADSEMILSLLIRHGLYNEAKKLSLSSNIDGHIMQEIKLECDLVLKNSAPVLYYLSTIK